MRTRRRWGSDGLTPDSIQTAMMSPFFSKGKTLGLLSPPAKNLTLPKTHLPLLEKTLLCAYWLLQNPFTPISAEVNVTHHARTNLRRGP